MQRKYFAIFIVLLCIPLAALIAVVTYCFFRMGTAEGAIALCASALVVAAVVAVVALKVKKNK